MASETAWRDLIVGQIPALRAFAWSVSRNLADADDLVQDTLFKAWRSRERFTPGTNLRAWLFTILRNTHYTTLSRRRREVRDEDDHFAAQLQTPPSQEWGVALEGLRAALGQLAPEQREAVILVGGGGPQLRGSRPDLRLRPGHGEEPGEPRQGAAHQAAGLRA